MTRSLVWAVAVVLLAGTGAVPAADVIETNLRVVARWELDHPASYGGVAVVGTTAVVLTEAAPAPGSPCPTSAVTLVDLRHPRSPQAVGSLVVPSGMTAADVDAVSVGTASFTGDLVALALVPAGGCGDGPGATVAYHDITDPAHPRILGQSAACAGCGTGPQSISLAQRADGQVLAVRTSLAGAGVAVDDVSDPAHPEPAGQWPEPAPTATGACGASGVVLHDDGLAAVAAFADGRVYDLDLTEPSRPSGGGGPAARSGGPARSRPAVLPLNKRTITIVAEDRPDEPGCAGGPAPEPGLRVLLLAPGSAPIEEEPVRYPGAGAPGRLVASGTLAYVTWHGAGLRVVDFAQVRARTIAQFVPASADVVGVALLPDHIVVTDTGSGLYVLARPDEGGARATFWSQFLSLLPYLGGAVVMAAVFAVPRLASRGASIGAGEGSPIPSPARRRRA